MSQVPEHVPTPLSDQGTQTFSPGPAASFCCAMLATHERSAEEITPTPASGLERCQPFFLLPRGRFLPAPLSRLVPVPGAAEAPCFLFSTPFPSLLSGPCPLRTPLSALRIALPLPSPDSKTVLVAQISLFFKSLAIFSWFSPLIFAQCSVICQQQRCRTGPWGASRAPARSSPCLGASPRHHHLPA